MPTDILVLAEGDFTAGESLKKKWLFFFAQIIGYSGIRVRRKSFEKV